MKKLVLVIAVLFVMISMTPSTPLQAAQYPYEITQYDIQVNVNSDNSYDITETLDVQFNEDRHGIFRTIPLMYDGRRIQIKDISVNGAPYETEGQMTYTVLKIGDPDIYITGNKTYVIHYTLALGYDYLETGDEINMNIIGVDWDTTIHNVSFALNMPFEYDTTQVNVYSGELGNTDGSDIDLNISQKIISGTKTSALMPYEGLTLLVHLPNGYLKDSKIPTPYMIYLSLLFLPLALLIWIFKGKDKRLIVTPEFNPPDGVTPSELGYYIDETIDTKDITALVIYWASKGYLTIFEDAKDQFIFTRLQAIGPESKPYEITLFKEFFALGDGQTVTTVQLKNHFYKAVQKAVIAQRKYLSDLKQPLYAASSKSYSSMIFMMAMIPLFILTFRSLQFVNFPFIGALALGIAISAFTVGINYLIAHTFVMWRRLSTGAKATALLVGFIFFLLTLIVMAIELSVLQQFKSMPIVILSTFMMGFLSKITLQRSEFGQTILEKTLGFKMFLETAEKSRIDMMVEKQPEYFYNVLPYALVLNVTDKWGKHFERLAVEPPSWYGSYRPYSNFNTLMFAHAMTHSFNSMNTTMVSAPSQSGHSSGGGGSW